MLKALVTVSFKTFLYGRMEQWLLYTERVYLLEEVETFSNSKRHTLTQIEDQSWEQNEKKEKKPKKIPIVLDQPRRLEFSLVLYWSYKGQCS